MDSSNTGSTPLLHLAVNYHQAGNLVEAEKLYRQILQAEPGHVHALHMLGVITHQQGRSDSAIDYLRQTLRLQPTFAEAHNSLGIVLKAQGKLDEAVASYQQALRLKPDYADACNNLGNALVEQGKLEEAVASYRQALRLKPDYAMAHSNLGVALKLQGKLEEAAASYRQALHLKPDHAVAHNSLGNVLADQGKLAEAVASYREALRLAPDYAEAHSNLGIALRLQGKFDEAVASCRQAVRFLPDYAEAYNNLGAALKDSGKPEEAIASYRQALRLKPDYAEAYNNLGVVFTETGRMDEAIASVQASIRLKPRNAGALWQLARLLGGKLPEADRVLLEKRLAEPDLSEPDRLILLFALAEVCDARRNYPQAAALFRQANALSLAMRRRKGQGYDVGEHARAVDNLMAAFPPAFFERVRGFGLDTERPVFIVGLPRSGTTLTEQILAAHSQVFGAGELSLARDDFHALGTPVSVVKAASFDLGIVKAGSFDNGESGPHGDTVRILAQRHLDRLSALNCTAARVVDKMPENYLYLGLLAAMFPRAKFIHCRRDLCDVALSCWMTYFVELRWTDDPDHILGRIREYQRLMEHWRAVLPVSMLEVQYEETVADLPGTARRLVEWCGLDWEPACLDFHQGIRPVRTASAIQVRQPVHTRSVARWRNYQHDLGGLFAALSSAAQNNGSSI